MVALEQTAMTDDIASAVAQWDEILQFVDDNMPIELPEGVGDPIFPPTRYVSILVTAEDAAALRALVKAVKGQEWQPTHRHKKRGTEYRAFEHMAHLQTDTPLTDMARLVIYESEAGALWARPPSEFDDGRFEAAP